MEVMDMLKSGYVLLIVATLSVFSTLTSAQDDYRWLIAPNRLASTDLKVVWQFNLPLADAETLDRIIISGSRLCALSSGNYLTCLNRNDGNVMFSTLVAAKGLPMTDLEPYKGELLTIIGSKLIVINTSFGTEQTSTDITSGVTCPVVRNDSFFYIAGADKRLHALKADNKVQVFEAAAENGSAITACLAEEDFVVFATEPGNVVSIAAERPRKLWQFDAPLAVAGTLVHDSKSLYFACRDTCIYRLELSSGRLVWKYQTSGVLDTTPQLGAKVVYQYVPDVGLIALAKDSGKLLWPLTDGAGLLAESGDKAFVITRTGLLTAMDNTKKKQLYTVNFEQPIKNATNSADSKIYIADDKGRVACIEPAK